jgi:hypothetical protein
VPSNGLCANTIPGSNNRTPNSNLFMVILLLQQIQREFNWPELYALRVTKYEK